MAAIYRIKQGETESPVMDASAASMVVLVTYYNGTAVVQPTTEGTLSISPDATGETFVPLLAYGPGQWRFNGPVVRVRLNLAGVAGVTSAQAFIWRDDESVETQPPGLYSGLRAITVQPYTEANVKNGLQFYLRAVWPTADPIVTGEPGSRLIWFKTGAKQVVVKLRDMLYVAEELRLRLFRAPTGVAGGTDLVIHNYNGVAPVATTCVAKKNVTVTTLGTEFDGGDPEFFFGEATSGNRTPTSIPQGRERILPANTEFIVQLTNLSTGGGSAARVQYYLDWYEGGTDLPLRQ